MEISDTVTLYAYAVDHRDWSVWGEVFTPNAVLDYSAFGMGVSSPLEWQSQLREMDHTLVSAQHLLLNQRILLSGDTASSRVEYHMTAIFKLDESETMSIIEGGGLYLDNLERTAIGWRIVHRRAKEKWTRKGEVQSQAPLAINKDWS